MKKGQILSIGNKQSITKRWATNNLVIIFTILILVVLILVLAVRAYYYSYVDQSIDNRMDFFSTKISEYQHGDGGGSVEETLRGLVERDFDGSSQMAVTVIDKNGVTVITSTGFPPEDVMGSGPETLTFFPESQQKSGVYLEKINGEPVKSAILRLQLPSNKLAAIKFSVSIGRINNQIYLIAFALTLVCCVILVLVIYSSSYFIKSIVRPVSEVSRTARKIAQGDFSVRLEVRTRDEIGDLCENINYMADELARSEEVKNEFISSVSHELRTPLTAIRGWAETLTMGGGDDPELLGRGMRVILSETERLGGMVEELLDFSRMQSGKFSLILDKTDVLAELEETVLMFAERARREGVTLFLDAAEYLPPAMADGNRMKQVFVNLLDNALKYTDTGGQITLSAYAKGDDLVIQIADTGCGIASEDLPQVKTRFYKGHGARRGSGIGLSLVEEIISRHHGTFSIESEVGLGTKVTVLLPTYEKWVQMDYPSEGGIHMKQVKVLQEEEKGQENGQEKTREV